ncbi:unnamed protein product [Malus baccata var. baccata]
MEWERGNRREIIGFTPRVGVCLNNQRPAQVEAARETIYSLIYSPFGSPFKMAESFLGENIWKQSLLNMQRLIPFEGEEGLLELERIAGGLEEKIYVAASSQPDYLWKISLKMLTMEMKSQTAPPPSNLKRYRVSA